MITEPNATAAGLVRLVAELLSELDGTAVTECEFRSGDHRVRLRRSPSFVPVAAPVAPEEEEVPPHWHSLASPLTGIFYVAENPQNPPLIRVGDELNVGQVIGLIEAMKTFNRVESDVSGTVRAILVVNGAEVQAGQTLLYVEPTGEPA